VLAGYPLVAVPGWRICRNFHFELVLIEERSYISIMKCGKMAVWQVGILLLLPAVGVAVSDDNPYKSIVSRNPFALVPPPPPPPAQPATPPANIKLTGITTMMGNKRALLMVQESGQKTEQSYILREGQREGQIEVLEIDEKAGSVKVKNGDVVSVLSFDKDGIKLAGGPPAAPPPPSAGSSVTPKTVPPTPAQRQIPARQLRLPRSQQNPQLPQTPQTQSIQSQRIQSQEPEPSPQLVAQLIAMEVHALEKKAEIDRGDYPPLPPTELRETFQPGSQSSDSADLPPVPPVPSLPP
jgi:hypothetical protein